MPKRKRTREENARIKAERERVKAEHDRAFPGVRENRRLSVQECVDALLEHERLQAAADFVSELEEAK